MEERNSIDLGKEKLVDPTHSSEAADPDRTSSKIFEITGKYPTTVDPIKSTSSFQEQNTFKPSDKDSECVPAPQFYKERGDEDTDDEVLMVSDSSPKAKKELRDAKVSKDDDLAVNPCPKCGGHYLQCSTCGYLFDKACIRWWFFAANEDFGLCPRCKVKVMIRNIRPLFARVMDVLNRTERGRVFQQLKFVSDDGKVLTLTFKDYPVYFRKMR